MQGTMLSYLREYDCPFHTYHRPQLRFRSANHHKKEKWKQRTLEKNLVWPDFWNRDLANLKVPDLHIDPVSV
jgi:hypothetical protein